uniref:Uncharacterized protein n=1 Tax=Arundo donax TaxID=35708 RepID=A0A0A8Y2I4_ARUDO
MGSQRTVEDRSRPPR